MIHSVLPPGLAAAGLLTSPTGAEFNARWKTMFPAAPKVPPGRYRPPRMPRHRRSHLNLIS